MQDFEKKVTFASNLEGCVGIEEGHARPRGQCGQKHGGGEVTMEVKCVLHMCRLIVICQSCIFDRCWSCQRKGLALLRMPGDNEEGRKKGHLGVTGTSCVTLNKSFPLPQGPSV